MAKFGQYSQNNNDTNIQHNNLVKQLNKEFAGYESGSNANGSYIKHADGTMICWHELETTAGNTASGNVFVSNAGITWTFPIEFYAKPELNAFPARMSVSGANCMCCSRTTGGDYTKTSATNIFVWYDVSNANVKTIISLTAIGRWKA